MATIDFRTDNAVWISDTLYCFTPMAMQIVKDMLTDMGYDMRDMRSEEELARRSNPITAAELESSKATMWFASLKGYRFGRCGSCSSRISTLGIQMHGHTCEVCGEVTFYDIVDGTRIRLEFGTSDMFSFKDIGFEAFHWDADTGWLYLKPEPVDSGMFTVTGEEATAYMAKHHDKWELDEYNGQPAIRVAYPRQGNSAADTGVQIKDIGFGMRNFKTIHVWDDVEYPEYPTYRDEKVFPVPTTISIYEAWRWAPLQPSPTLFEDVLRSAGQTPDPFYHYQDGRVALSVDKYHIMGKFIRHCTTLDADLWDSLVPTFPLDGPGSIYAVARFCHPDSKVKGTPNIGNVLSVAAGFDRSTAGLAAAAVALANDTEARELIAAMHNRLVNRT